MTDVFYPSKDKPGIYDGWLADSYELGNGKISAVWFGGTRYAPEQMEPKQPPFDMGNREIQDSLREAIEDAGYCCDHGSIQWIRESAIEIAHAFNGQRRSLASYFAWANMEWEDCEPEEALVAVLDRFAVLACAAQILAHSEEEVALDPDAAFYGMPLWPGGPVPEDLYHYDMLEEVAG